MRPREFGEGPLSRVSSYVYTLMAVGVLLTVASLPTYLLVSLLAEDLSNIPLVGLCAVPLGPALSAAVYALHHRRANLTELRPLRQFLHAYRLNFRAVLPVWALGLVWLIIIGLTMANFRISGFPAWWAVLLLIIGLVAVLWTVNALVIASLFDFRFGDAVKLAWEMIPRTPVSALGNAGVVIGAVLLAHFTSNLVLLVFSVVFVNALVVTSRPTIELVTADYTRPAQ